MNRFSLIDSATLMIFIGSTLRLVERITRSASFPGSNERSCPECRREGSARARDGAAADSAGANYPLAKLLDAMITLNARLDLA